MAIKFWYTLIKDQRDLPSMEMILLHPRRENIARLKSIIATTQSELNINQSMCSTIM